MNATHDGIPIVIFFIFLFQALSASDYLGTWLFEGYVVGGREFVGDWRVTSRTTYYPGEQGWFTLTKAVEWGKHVPRS